jgi:hypothetical protein
MKAILLSVIVFMAMLFFMVTTLKKQSGKIQEATVANKAQKAQDKALEKENLATQDRNNRLLTSFAARPLENVSNRDYSNFFDDAVIKEGKIYRWTKPNLTYYIDSATARNLSKGKVRQAFSYWARKSKIFTFNEVPKPEQADILVHLASTSEKNRLGEAGPDKAYAGQFFELRGKKIQELVIHHAQVTISIEHFDIYKERQYQKEGKDHGFQTLVHELGHVLGIMGHSPSIGDCMYYQADQSARACNVMTREVNTLAMIYGKPSSLTKGFGEFKQVGNK